MAKQKEDRGRFSSKRKMEAVLRLLKGETLDAVSRDLGVTAAKLSEWRDEFLKSAEAGLKSREPSAAEDENLRLKAKVGELTMELELLRIKAGLDPLPWRKSRG
jgi:transposase-like protein